MTEPFDGMKERRGTDPWRDLRDKAAAALDDPAGPDLSEQELEDMLAAVNQPATIAFQVSGVQKGMNEAVHDLLERKRRIDAYVAWLEELVDEKDEDILYEAIDELRQRWHQARPLLYSEGPIPLIDLDRAPLPTYRQALADRDEFGQRSIKLARKLRRVRRKLRHARKI